MKIINISITLISLLFISIRTQAQMNPEMQKLMEKQNAKVIQQLEKDDPRIKDMIEKMRKDPSMKKQLELMGMDSTGSAVDRSESLSQSNSDESNTKNGAPNQTIQDFYPMPVQNLNHHALGLPQLKVSDISGLAQDIIKHTKFLNLVLKKKLDDMAKSPKINISGTGSFYLLLGLPTDACGYLIAKGIIAHPTNPYAANGFGVYFRDKHDLVHALQCFFYANKLLPAKLKSPYIYTNIGWASFYYGDFKTAGKYFDSALSVSNSFVPALEGQATLAFTKGDIKTLFACLVKELLAMTKTAGGGGGAMSSGPSPGFASVCGGVYSSGDDGSNQSSPFDHIGDDDNSPDQAAPPDADVTFPGLFKPVIINDLLDGASEAIININAAEAKANSVIEALKKKQQALNPRYAGRSYINEEGNLAHDRDYSNFHNLHGLIILQFESRVDKDIKSFEKFTSDYNTKTINRSDDLSDKWSQVGAECGDNAPCAQAKYCIITKQAHLEGNNFLEIGSEKWGKLYDKVVDDINWFLKNDAFFVSRVPDVKCNEDMNIDREIETATAILEAYDCLKEIYGPLTPFETLARLKVKCPPTQMAGIASVSLSKAPKHIKEYEDKKYCQDITFSIGVLGSITENCHTTTISIGTKIGILQLGFSYTTNKDLFSGKVKDQIYSKNNDFDHSYGANAGIAYKCGEIIEIDAGVGGSLTYNSKGERTAASANVSGGGAVDFGASGKIGATASRTWQMDGNWNITGYSNNVTASVNLGGNTSIDEKDPNQKSSGHSLSEEYSVTSVYDAAGNYIGGNTSLKASLQGSATTNVGTGNSERATQNNYFGININQVIQVVAGQEDVSPPTVSSY